MYGSTKYGKEPSQIFFLSKLVIFHLNDSGRLNRLFGPKSGLGKFKCPDKFSPSYLIGMLVFMERECTSINPNNLLEIIPKI
jgi:hypothetical protein